MRKTWLQIACVGVWVPSLVWASTSQSPRNRVRDTVFELSSAESISRLFSDFQFVYSFPVSQLPPPQYPSASVEELIEGLGSPRFETRRRSFLELMRRPSSIPQLEQATESADIAIAHSAVSLLQQLGKPILRVSLSDYTLAFKRSLRRYLNEAPGMERITWLLKDACYQAFRGRNEGVIETYVEALSEHTAIVWARNSAQSQRAAWERRWMGALKNNRRSDARLFQKRVDLLDLELKRIEKDLQEAESLLQQNQKRVFDALSQALSDVPLLSVRWLNASSLMISFPRDVLVLRTPFLGGLAEKATKWSGHTPVPVDLEAPALRSEWEAYEVWIEPRWKFSLQTRAVQPVYQVTLVSGESLVPNDQLMQVLRELNDENGAQ